ncbi:uncharacterized protein LOC120125037 [Hibiscus syriacus]|uniref:uncharacterized protein LOC120125037 n=1 Tax=Hibiscus syriacus TaxID=106335 RepID=UPI0019213AED|nr:uncharacterized protein LOC120125037 [Hibiscus syriacus]
MAQNSQSILKSIKKNQESLVDQIVAKLSGLQQASAVGGKSLRGGNYVTNSTVSPYPMDPIKPPYPRWYDENAHCEYHGGVQGHSIEGCLAFKRLVQRMQNKNWITFDTPNVSQNPLPNHPETGINAITTENGRRIKTNVSEVKAPLAWRLPIDTSHMRACQNVFRAFDGTKREVVGKIEVSLTIEPATYDIEFLKEERFLDPGFPSVPEWRSCKHWDKVPKLKEGLGNFCKEGLIQSFLFQIQTDLEAALEDLSINAVTTGNADNEDRFGMCPLPPGCTFKSVPLIITAIYASNDGVTRRQLWQQLRDMEAYFGSLPWILGGDYNAILHSKESSDYEHTGPILTPYMKDFQDFTHDLLLQDHHFFGPSFTWSNKQQQSFLAKKLDRVLINSTWVNTFHNSFVEFLALGVSDHCMALVWINREVQANRPKPFKFFNFWTLHPNFLNEVRQSWQPPIQGNLMKVLFLKLKRLKTSLKTLNKEYYSDLSARVRQKQSDLEQLQLSTLRGRDTIAKELMLQNELLSLEEAERMYLKQKAKVKWLKERDKCTKFFHSIISGTEDSGVRNCAPNLLKDLLQFNLPSDVSSNLVKEVTDEEIQKAIFIQGNDKAPGPNGFTPYFFKKSWSVVGKDVVNAIKYFFQETFILPAFNATTIDLIPNVPNPNKVRDFRPISCCSVIYKTITKILVKRLTTLLPEIISLNQSTFVKGRNIVDNTLLAQELVREYGRKVISPRCALKVDLQKDFDTLHWVFISAMLNALQLPNTFIGWIETCFKEARYSISFDGSLIGFFKGARGIRQGDPLSPILFVLAMNVLSRILNIAATKGLFAYHPKCKKIGLTHLSFTDDLLIFCKRNIESVSGVISALDQFYEMSGLKLNATKCELYTAGISFRNLEHILHSTGFKHDNLPVRYLGVPLVTRKLTEKGCVVLLEKIKSKLHHWSGTHLSYADRLELIRVILFSIANFWCRQLILPQAIVNRIEQLCSRFFWKGADEAATRARVSWQKICQTKYERGLGLKDTKTWNKACMIQLIRNILAGEGSFWVAWIKSYVIKGADILLVDDIANSSWCIRRLLKLRATAIPVLSTGATKTKDFWKELRVKGDKVSWHKLIWFPLHVPKHIIITWMTLLDRLPTRERLRRMGIVTDVSCIICNDAQETRDHLFSECPMVVSLWKAILNLSGLSNTNLPWMSMIDWANGAWKDY